MTTAGLIGENTFPAMDRAAWARAVDVGAPAGHDIRPNGGGRIVLVSSVNALASVPAASHYSAAKAALQMMPTTRVARIGRITRQDFSARNRDRKSVV